MFGSFDYTFQYSDDDISLGILRDRDFYRYFRELKGKKRIEKIISSESGGMIVNPVEPLNIPEEITNYLEIEFESIFIEPLGKKDIFLTFPVDVGVFASAKNSIEIIDIFSLNKPKYSLYGSPSHGVITRWTWSQITCDIPEVDPRKEGVLKVSIENTTKDWAVVSRIVLEGYGMKLYYGRNSHIEIVSMMARMRILSKLAAETEFYDQPLSEGMTKSIELHTARDIPIVRRGYAMEWGLD